MPIRPPVSVVPDGVVDQVGGQPLQQAGVAEHGRRADRGADGAVRARRRLARGRPGPRVVMSARSTGSRWSRPRWLRARVSSASISVPAAGRWRARLRRWRGRWRRSAWGSARATSSRVRVRVSGVRSSWEALATNCRWASKAASSRASRPSMVSARSFSSSPGPGTASRSVQVVLGDRAGGGGHLPAAAAAPARDSQPSASDSTAMTASAMADTTSSWCSMAACWRTTWAVAWAATW